MRFAIFLALTMLLAGCSSAPEAPDGQTPTTTTRTTVSGSPVVSSAAPTPTATSATPSTPAVFVTPTPTPPTPEVPPLSGTRIIRMHEYRFEPADIVVAKGTILDVQNLGVLSHTITSDTGVFDTGNVKQEEDFELPMTLVGKFPYHCNNHPQMRGNITVIEPPAEPTPTTPTPSPTVNASKQSATIFDFEFRPRSPVWSAGTEVTWTNTGSRTHTVTAHDGSFDSGDIARSGTWTATFNAPGNYTYKCKYHASMQGTITITAA